MSHPDRGRATYEPQSAASDRSPIEPEPARSALACRLPRPRADAVVDADADRIALYRDGTVVDQAMRPSDLQPGDPTLYFGQWNMAGRLLSGDLDDIAIWSRALTTAEVVALNSQSP
jgi:concanavalin A-like lectin/glucanase superfamily protein